MPEHVIVLMMNTIFIIPFIFVVMRYYRIKNTEWRDELKQENKVISDNILSLSKNIAVLTNHVNNNIRSELIKVLNRNIKGLRRQSQIEKRLLIFFKLKINEYSSLYHEIKNIGLDNLRQQNFSSILSGSGASEIILMSKLFTPEFQQQCEAINIKYEKELKQSIFTEISLNTTDDKIALIKTVFIELFSQFIQDIYQAYKEIHFNTSDVKKEKLITVADTLHVDGSFLRDLIGQGAKGVERAINLIQISISDDDKLNELAIYSARYYDYMEKVRLNLPVEDTELNNIRNSLLKLIDSL